MLNYHEILAALRGEQVHNPHAQLWGERLSGNSEQEIFGSLPLTFKSYADYLKDYRIYGNTVQNGTPTPENPVEVVGCGERTENLFNKNMVHVGGYISADSGVIVSSSASFATDYIEVESGKIYYWNDIEARTNSGAFYDENKVYISGFNNRTSFNFSVPSGVKYVRLTGLRQYVDEYMLTPGATAPAEYVPYGYEIDAKVSVVNLWTSTLEQGTTAQGRLSPADNRVRSSIFNITSGTFTFYFENYTEYQIAYDAYAYGILKEATSWLNVYHFTLPDNTTNIRLKIKRKDDANFIPSDIHNIMLTPGTTPPSHYEPIATPIYIGTEPLYKIGDYADYVDYKRGVVVRRIKKLVLTGKEKDIAYFYGDNAHRYALVSLNNAGFPNSIILSSHFIWGGYTPLYGIAGRITSSSLEIFRCFIWSNIDNLDDFISYLSAQYEAGTPVTVWYVLAEPEEEPLENLLPIQTIKGTNILTADTTVQPSEMYIKGKIKSIT